MIYHRIKNKIKNKKREKSWREHNPNNYTRAVSEFDFDRVTIGNYTYGDINVRMFGTTGNLQIGNFCSIAGNVKFILCADHPVNHISTYPFRVKCLKTDIWESVSKGNIIVRDDVWICENALVLSGVKIGQGAVVAAGAVVVDDVPPYAIVAGVPAKIVRYRFSSDIIDELIRIDFGKIRKEDIEMHINDLYEVIENNSDAERLTEWMPKK